MHNGIILLEICKRGKNVKKMLNFQFSQGLIRYTHAVLVRQNYLFKTVIMKTVLKSVSKWSIFPKIVFAKPDQMHLSAGIVIFWLPFPKQTCGNWYFPPYAEVYFMIMESNKGPLFFSYACFDNLICSSALTPKVIPMLPKTGNAVAAHASLIVDRCNLFISGFPTTVHVTLLFCL